MASQDELRDMLRVASSLDAAFKFREKSRSEIRYGKAAELTARALKDFIPVATFDQLLKVERIFQQHDLQTYARLPATLHSVQEGIFAINEGLKDYKLLLENPEVFQRLGFLKKDRTPDGLIHLDSMRKALRNHARRVENYRRNVMGNTKEHEFLTARVTMIRRAEKLYDTIQRGILSPPTKD